MVFNTTEIIELMDAVPSILDPVTDIIIIVIKIMIVLAIGGLVTGILYAIVDGIKKKIKM